ncbi:hypothetical protein GCM10010429_52620 [Micromonospora olivasterospora]
MAPTLGDRTGILDVFVRAEPRATAGQFVEGPLSGVEPKTVQSAAVGALRARDDVSSSRPSGGVGREASGGSWRDRRANRMID